VTRCPQCGGEFANLAKHRHDDDIWPSPTGQKRWTGKAWIIIGGVFLAAWLLIWLVPGVVFAGSVSQVSGLCAGTFFSNLNSSSCQTASTATSVAWVLFGLGAAGVIRGLWRWYHGERRP
jgi:hypothetical protein